MALFPDQAERRRPERRGRTGYGGGGVTIPPRQEKEMNESILFHPAYEAPAARVKRGWILTEHPGDERGPGKSRMAGR
jgi:hypothetical protein